MANPFDQFDTVKPAAAPQGSAPAPQGGKNPFDQFDKPAPVAAPLPTGGDLAREFGTGLVTGIPHAIEGMTDAMARGQKMGLPPGMDLIGGMVAPALEGLGVPGFAEPPGTIHPSEAIKAGLSAVKVNPDDYFQEAKTPIERIARMGGEGVVTMIMPGGQKVSGPLEALKLLLAGGAGGAASQAAVEVAPDNLKPAAALVGGTAGGIGGMAVGELAHAGVSGAGNAIKTMAAGAGHEGAQQSIAGQMLSEAANDPAKMMADLKAGAGNEVVPGVKPSLFQATDDPGIGTLSGVIEREPGKHGTDAFVQRKKEQNAALIQSVRDTQAEGHPEAVAELFRTQLADIDQMTQRAQDAANDAVQKRQEGMGGTRPVSDIGESLRTSLQDSLTAAKQRENVLWRAVDPEGKMKVVTGPLKRAIRGAYDALGDAAKIGVTGTEKALTAVIDGYGATVSFKELTDLRSQISQAMREAKSPMQPNDVAYGRLSQLRAAVEDAIEDSISGKVVDDQQAVAAGTMSAEDTLAANIARQVEAWRGERGAVASGESGGIGAAAGRGEGPGAAAGLPGAVRPQGSGPRGAASPEGVPPTSRGAARRPVDASPVYDTMRERFAAAGRPDEEAAAAASVVDAFYRTAAQRAGVPVEELMKTHPLPEVTRGGGGEGFDQSARAASPDTPEFKRWFGDSKVVDAEGRPLVVYHGSNRSFGKFESRDGMRAGEWGRPETVRSEAFFFTPDRSEANMFARDRVKVDQKLRDLPGGRAQTRPFYLKAEYPLDLTGHYTGYPDPDAAVILGEAGGYDYGYGPETWQDVHRVLDNPEAIDWLREEGFDAVKLKEDSGATSWAVFEPTQIKSVNNRGTFDPNDPRILFQSGEAQPARGRINFGDDGKSTISLFEGADASTAMHESGHHFLRMFKDMAEGPNAPEAIANDWSAVKAWWGKEANAVAADAGQGVTAADVRQVLRDGTTGDRMKDLAVNTGLHEQWARAFESYLRDGKAPNGKLRAAFEQFKQWLTSLYKRADELGVNVSPEIRGVFDRMLTPEDRAAARSQMAPGKQGAASFDQPAWHGTPHRFEKFDSSKIGTGEGAQAYGHGLYFASKKGVAEHYRDGLSGKAGNLVAGVPESDFLRGLEQGSAEHRDAKLALANLDRYSTPDAVVERMRKVAATHETQGPSYARAADWLERNKAKISRPKGRLFEVDVPDDTDLMNWDAPLSEQPPKVKEALRPLQQSRAADIQAKTGLKTTEADIWDINGEDLYREISAQLGGDTAASKAFREAGIPGHKYTGHESQSTNYVIYDDSKINVRGFEQPSRGPMIDADAAQRLRTASAATKERKETFGAQPVSAMLRREGASYPYKMPSGDVVTKAWTSGPKGADSVRSILRAANNAPQAVEAMSDAAMASLRAKGPITAKSLSDWRTRHSDALAALDEASPGVAAQYDALAASLDQAADAAAIRRDALSDVETSALGKILRVEDGADVTRAISGVLGKPDSVRNMRRIVAEAGADPDAMAGLRKALADTLVEHLVSEAAEGRIKGATFNKFLGKNEPALREVFSADEIANLRKVAAEIKRLSRSVQTTPGSATGQWRQAAEKFGEHKQNLIVAALQALPFPGVSGAAAFVLSGGNPMFYIPASVIGAAGSYLRNAGINNAKDLVRRAMLDPELAKTLLMKAPKRPDAGSLMTLKKLLLTSGAIGGISSAKEGYARGGTVLDRAAHSSATSPHNNHPEPSQAQKEAGNYRKGHVRLGGLDIAIENPVGSVRSGTDRDGKAWKCPMCDHYGYIKGTVGKDKDHIDTFIAAKAGSLADDAPVFVVNQIDPRSGKFDEHKVMLGYGSKASAKAAYLRNYAKDWKGLGSIIPTTLAAFKAWLGNGKTSRPFAPAYAKGGRVGMADGGTPFVNGSGQSYEPPSVPLDTLSYSANGTRRLPIKPELADALRQSVTAVYGPNYRVDVMSAAQPPGPKGTPGTTGTRRHGTGVAADVWVYAPDGHRLAGDELVPLSQHWLASGNGSVGFPANASNSLHLDLIGGKGPGAVPLKKGEGRVWYYGKPSEAQRTALDSSLTKGVAPKYAIPPEVVAKGLVPPADIPNVPKVATATSLPRAVTPATMSPQVATQRAATQPTGLPDERLATLSQQAQQPLPQRLAAISQQRNDIANGVAPVPLANQAGKGNRGVVAAPPAAAPATLQQALDRKAEIMRQAQTQPPQTLTTRKVNTVPVDGSGKPLTAVQAAAEREAARLRTAGMSQRPDRVGAEALVGAFAPGKQARAVSTTGPIMPSGVVPDQVALGTGAVKTFIPPTSVIKTANPLAGQVALPAGVRPASVPPAKPLDPLLDPSFGPMPLNGNPVVKSNTSKILTATTPAEEWWGATPFAKPMDGIGKWVTFGDIAAQFAGPAAAAAQGVVAPVPATRRQVVQQAPAPVTRRATGPGSGIVPLMSYAPTGGGGGGVFGGVRPNFNFTLGRIPQWQGATAITNGVAAPGLVMGGNNTYFDQNYHPDTDMAIYHANREALGGQPITQQSLNNAAANGTTLYRR